MDMGAKMQRVRFLLSRAEILDVVCSKMFLVAGRLGIQVLVGLCLMNPFLFCLAA